MDAFIARQPIFDRQNQVYGYELLFREGADTFFRGADGDFATGSLISDAVHLHGLTKLTEGRKCFVNFTRASQLNELYTVLPADSTVVEVLETVEPDGPLIEACQRARSAGYLLALDDYILQPRFEILLPLIDVLKVEFPALSDEQHQMIMQSARTHGFRTLAEKVESPDEHARAMDYGYSCFQGYFFCRPQLLQSRRLPSSKLQNMRLLQLVNQPVFNIDRIEQVIRQDLALSYKLLRFLNSAVFRLHNKVESIRHAVTLLGQRPLQRWGSLLCLSELGNDKPPELLKTCLVRGRFCEVLGEKVLPRDQSEECFTVGMFSLLDAVLDRPMDSVVQELALSPVARNSLLFRDSPLRPVIDLLTAVEQADWQRLAELTAALGVDDATVSEIYTESVSWAGEILGHSS